MNKPEHISPELIERYLKGELSAEEQQALRDAAERDPFLADALEGFAEARDQHVDMEAVTKRLDDKVADRFGYKKSGVVIPMNLVWRVSAVAAAILIVGGSVFIFNSINKEQELAQGPDTPAIEESVEPESEATESADDPNTGTETFTMEGGSIDVMDSTSVMQEQQPGYFTSDHNGIQGPGLMISYGKQKQKVNHYWYSPPGMQQDQPANGWAFEQNQKALDNTGYLALVFEADAIDDDEVLIADIEPIEEPVEVVEEVLAMEADRNDEITLGDSEHLDASPAPMNDNGLGSGDVIAGNLEDKKAEEVTLSGGRTQTLEEAEVANVRVEASKDALTAATMSKTTAEPTAYDEYFAGNYKTAATKFEDLVKEKPADLEAKYYLGLSNFNSNKLNKAISSFDEILAQPDNLYTDGAIWYKAQSLIKKGKEDEALPLLQELSTRENTYKQSASEMMIELDD